jgi:hypothetical protein
MMEIDRWRTQPKHHRLCDSSIHHDDDDAFASRPNVLIFAIFDLLSSSHHHA